MTVAYRFLTVDVEPNFMSIPELPEHIDISESETMLLLVLV